MTYALKAEPWSDHVGGSSSFLRAPPDFDVMVTQLGFSAGGPDGPRPGFHDV